MAWNNFHNRKNKYYKHYKVNRNYDDKQYKKFLAQVRKRDVVCQMPNCGADSPLQVHHIQLWSKAVHLRYDVKNGILLCKKCHDLIKGKEHVYAELFTRIVLRKYDGDNDVQESAR